MTAVAPDADGFHSMDMPVELPSEPPRGLPLDLLVLRSPNDLMAGLCSALAEVGNRVDQVHSLREAQAAFLYCGGHQLLIVAPDVRACLVQEVMGGLRSVDPQLEAIVFGHENLSRPAPMKLTLIKSFHPSSRAGVGAVMKILRTWKSPEAGG